MTLWRPPSQPAAHIDTDSVPDPEGGRAEPCGGATVAAGRGAG